VPPEAAIVSTLATENPSKAHLMALRFEERQRLFDFKRRLADMDSERHARAMAALEQVAQASADRLAEIEAALAGAQVDGLLKSPAIETDTGQITTTAEARDALRQRLQHLALVIDRHSPPSCASAAANLQRAINIELRRLDSERRGP
jgi:hypothetical protein